MPTYEYACDKCGYSFEKWQKMQDDPLAKCPKCDFAVRRLIGTGAGIIFKGSGFYQTDYKKTPECGGKGPKNDKPAACPKSDTCSSCG